MANTGSANISKIRLAEQGSNPASPASTYQFLFVKSGGVYVKDSAGNVTGPLAGNPMTTQDDIIVGGASGIVARLAKGSDGQVLTVNVETHHLDWETPSSGISDGTWTDYSGTSTIVGWASYTTKLIYYKQVGKNVFVNYTINGTSNSNPTSFSLPATSAAGITFSAVNRSFDNGGSSQPGLVNIAASGTTATFYLNLNGGGWTATGNKYIEGQFWYVST